MRTIEFRGKRVDNTPKNGSWVYGDLTHEFKIEKQSNVRVIRVNGYDVDEKTIGQFTGLLDKSGKKIYEGDIFEKKVHPNIYERVYNQGGSFKEKVTVHNGVTIRSVVEYNSKVAQFQVRTIYVNPTGVKVGSTIIPRTEIAVGNEYFLDFYVNEHRKSEVIGNIHDNLELLTNK